MAKGAIQQAVAASPSMSARTRKAELLEAYAPDINKMLDYWSKADDLVTGYDAVKKKGETYLPKFNDETKPDYDFRLKCTKFTNVFRDIVESLSAKPFEEEITLVEGDDKAKAPEQILEFIEDVDGSGNNITAFGANTMFNGVAFAIDWIFIDYPSVEPGTLRTREDQKRANIRPFWSHVLGQNVREANVDVINGSLTLTYIRIFEPATDGNHGVREFQRDETGRITWMLWRKNKSRGEYDLEASGVLGIDEIPLVPFITGRRDGTSFRIFPPMQDAADLQVELYQQESALKFVKVLAAYPMLAGNGIVPDTAPDGTPKKLAIGPMRVLYSKPRGDGQAGEWKYLEPNANTMKFLAEDVKATIDQLREIGRQPLTAQSGNLTVITTMVAAGKSKSAVGAWALLLKNALENALVITAKWMSIKQETYDPEVNVYNEFDEYSEEGKDLEALDKARARGDLSRETYLAEFKRRKVLSPEFDYAREAERILNEGPVADEFEDEEEETPPTESTETE